MVCPGLCGLLLVACATTKQETRPPPAAGDATWHMVQPESTRRYELAMGDVSSGAVPFHRVAPVYPPSLLASCPSPVEVQALLVVNQEGKVDDVRVVDEVTADAERHLYIDAVRVAARQWDFSPLQITHWAADANGESHVVDSKSRPFSLTYAFRFECHAGRAEVSTSDTPPAGVH
ncbi:hypothetical protein [Dyella koreensis]|uniref:hypothetical protein n=1 Tax=Dyella koreensis TaxID=311235 RepID=UPI00360B4140